MKEFHTPTKAADFDKAIGNVSKSVAEEDLKKFEEFKRKHGSK